MELSKRLQTIADMVTRGNRVADVGCDHGFVSIYLYQQNIAPVVYAMDVRTGPLARAKEHIEEYGLSKYIETRLSDGVTALNKGEADALICAGMGGKLMAKILLDGIDKILAMKELILQPQSDLAFFRNFLREQGLVIVHEDMVFEEGKFYPMMRVVPKAMMSEADAQAAYEQSCAYDKADLNWQRREDLFGTFLLRQKHPVLKEYLETVKSRNIKILEGLQTEKGLLRREEILAELDDIEECLKLFKQ